MIQVMSKIKVADNSGAKEIKCIKIYKNSNKQFALLGDLFIAVVNRKKAKKKIKRGIYKGLLIATKSKTRRFDGTFIKFDENQS